MKKNCQFCNGTGQINYFKGVSRFLISYDECPECGGLGIQPTTEEHVKNKEESSSLSACTNLHPKGERSGQKKKTGR